MAVTLTHAEIAVSVNDNHTVLKNGAMVASETTAPDTLSVIDLSQNPPKILSNIELPASVTGPPTSVVVAPDESFAIVTSATHRSPQDQAKLVPDDRVFVVDLAVSPPEILQETAAGQGASGVSLSPDGKAVLVANRNEGTISVFSLTGKKLEAKGKLDLGNPKAGPSSILFVSPTEALVSRDTDNMISQLHVEDDKVTILPRSMTSAIRPYTIAKSASGRFAAVSNLGRSDGDADTVSLIDTMAMPMRVVETVSVPSTPEGLKFSPDGTFLAVGSQDGSNKPEASPFRKEHGRLVIFAVGRDGNLHKVTEAPLGHWSQGIAFSRDGHTILVQNMVERMISVFHFEAGVLTPQSPIAIDAGPAGLATAW
jgi:DNA-binding beta-propeller fold protein YncE